MQLSLDERKQQLVLQCQEEYATKPRKWWQFSPDNTYKSTWDCYKEHNYPRVYVDEIIIRRDKENAIFALVGVCFFGLLFFVITVIQAWLIIQIIVAIIACYFIYQSIRNLLDDKPKITFTKEGLWTRGWGYTIPWADIVVSCIRMDSSDEITDHFLRIHFYDPFEDDFKKAEYDVNGLEKEPDTIACFVHQFRMDFGKTDPACTTISFSQQAAG